MNAYIILFDDEIVHTIIADTSPEPNDMKKLVRFYGGNRWIYSTVESFSCAMDHLDRLERRSQNSNTFVSRLLSGPEDTE